MVKFKDKSELEALCRQMEVRNLQQLPNKQIAKDSWKGWQSNSFHESLGLITKHCMYQSGLKALILIAVYSLFEALPIYSQTYSPQYFAKYSQDLSQTNTVNKLPFRSQFSQNLERNFQAAKSQGCFILYDLKRDRYMRYNSERCQKRFIPASTFKIFNSLVALETKAIADENTVIAWNKIENPTFTAWNQDQTMRTAFTRSVVWFYQELARRIGKEQMQKYIQAAGYGNQDISDQIDSFWLNGKLRISPEEQIKFLVRLYKEELPFSVKVMQTVKDIMVIERQDDYILRGKTGWGMNVDGVKNIGWYVGYLEKGENVYFYALNLENQESNFEMIPTRKKILFDVFRDFKLVE